MLANFAIYPSILKVLLVEDHLGTAEALASDLESIGMEVTIAASVSLALKLVGRCQIALVDMRLDGVDGSAFIREAKVPCIALSAFYDKEMVETALGSGAIGYLTKDASLGELSAAIERAEHNQSTLSDKAMNSLVALFQQSSTETTDAKQLSPKELELLQCFSRGASYADAAAELGIGIGTVQTYVKRIYQKLGVSSKVQACSLALRLGWIQL